MKISKIIRRLFYSDDNAEKYDMVFDWELAARLISYIKPYIACQVLEDNFKDTRNVIYQDGVPVHSKAVRSRTKRPMIIIDSKTPLPCFKLVSEIDETGSWTKEALKMLEGKI